MPLTASNTDACTSAATRVELSADVPATTADRNNVWFQSVTSSARAALVLEPDIASAIAEIVRSFLVNASWSARSIHRQGGDSPWRFLGNLWFLEVVE